MLRPIAWTGPINDYGRLKSLAFVIGVGLTACGLPTSAVPSATVVVPPTPLWTAIETATPTPDVAMRRRAVIEMLASKTCRPPCFFGITPGATTQLQALGQLTRMGISTVEYEDTRGRTFLEGGFDFLEESIFQGLSLYVKDGEVLGLRVSAETSAEELRLKGIWDGFSPETIVDEYREPSRVSLQLLAIPRGDPSSNASYGVWVFYDEVGFAIHYRGLSPSTSPYEICPIFDDGGNLAGALTFYSVARPMGPDLEDLIGDELGIPETLWSLQEASGIDIVDLVALIARRDSNVCFEASVPTAQ